MKGLGSNFRIMFENHGNRVSSLELTLENDVADPVNHNLVRYLLGLE